MGSQHLPRAALGPFSATQLGVIGLGWWWRWRRLGGAFAEACRGYAERESWGRDRMDALVTDSLRTLLRRAHDEVPFYRDRIAAAGMRVEDIGRITAAELARLPLLDKQIVRENPELILTDRARRKPPRWFTTSGSTGTPIRVYCSPRSQQEANAVRAVRSFGWAGVSCRSPRSMIGGRLVVPASRRRPPFWVWNPWERQVYLSAFHIAPDHVPHYVAILNRVRPVVMTGYASANYFLARMVQELGLHVHSPKAIITSSEGVTPGMRLTLETVFRTRVYEEYGLSENCALATQCEHGRLHVHPDFGCVELITGDGGHAKPGEPGEIVATAFGNTDQLFIRYRTGDVGIWSPEPCPCGRSSLPVLRELVGRLEDTVVGPDGRETVRFHGLFLDMPGIAEGQVVQETLKDLIVNVVPTQSYSSHDAQTIASRVADLLGDGVRTRVCLLDSIPREASGKFRAVVSHVRRDRAIRDRSE